MAGNISLAGKVAVITGAAGGMGRAVATALREAGARLVLADADPGVAALAESVGMGDCHPIRVDVSDASSVAGLFSEAGRVFGKVDILVNLAAILRVSPFLTTTEEDWERTQAVNLKGSFLCCQAAARMMVERGEGGRIVNVASNAGMVPRVGNAAYCASKAGVILLTRVMALELAAHGICVNALCPGATSTEMLMIQAFGNAALLDRIIKGDPGTYRAGIPMGRLAAPEDQAAMVLFLVSAHAGHITGQTLVVDGGQTMV